MIRNSLQKKSTVERSSNVGLENIKQQYEILSGKKVEVEEEREFFTVRIPCIYKTVNQL